jgi:nifR3 family TIM-barrel protein
MAGVTNPPFRQLCRRFGAGLYVSEMVTARGLLERSRRTEQLATFAPGERPRSIQLYGVDPWAMGEAVRRLVGDDLVDHVDLNFGCPARKVTRHGGGAALPVKRDLFARMVRAAVTAAGSIPVTVKCRLGLKADVLTYLDAGSSAEEEGAAAMALHARTAEQLYSGHADWSAIGRLKERVTTIPVLGNGDVWEAPDALRMMRETGCDGVVIGRGCLGRPWLFGDLAAAFDGRAVPPPPRLGETIAVMVEHARRHVEWFGPDGIRDFRKHTSWYLKGYPIGGTRRHGFGQVASLAELEALSAELEPQLELPASARRAPRGHTGGPRKVSLPHGWLDEPGLDGPLTAEAETLVSGG